MNTKELGEIRRRIAPGRCAINRIYGCYVNSARQIISQPTVSFALLTNEEAEKYSSLLKKTLSGTKGKNLIDLSFSSEAVMNGEAHRLLLALLESGLADEEARQTFFDRVISSLPEDGFNHLILLAADTYDVPFRAGDGESLPDSSGTVYRYLLSAVCPVRDGKSELGYVRDENEFHVQTGGQLVGDPSFGFLFPSFDDRAANLYGALFFTKDQSEGHDKFLDAVFAASPVMTAPEQRDTFSEALAGALEDDCRFEVVQALHEQVREKLSFHKESKAAEALAFSSGDVGDMLRESGVPEEKIVRFQKSCDESFGHDAPLDPTTVMESRKFEILTPMVKISVDPQFSSRIETRFLDGRKYLLIPADEGVEINGVVCRIEAGSPSDE